MVKKITIPGDKKTPIKIHLKILSNVFNNFRKAYQRIDKGIIKSL
jgi:hypothetical protein